MNGTQGARSGGAQPTRPGGGVAGSLLAHPKFGPLPGLLLVETGETGHLIAVALLALACLGIIASLAIRPPRTVPAATWRIVIGLSLMFVLAPATRFGYFLYPAGLLAWLGISWLAFGGPAGLPGSAARSANADLTINSNGAGLPCPMRQTARERWARIARSAYDISPRRASSDSSSSSGSRR